LLYFIGSILFWFESLLIFMLSYFTTILGWILTPWWSLLVCRYALLHLKTFWSRFACTNVLLSTSSLFPLHWGFLCSLMCFCKNNPFKTPSQQSVRFDTDRLVGALVLLTSIGYWFNWDWTASHHFSFAVLFILFIKRSFSFKVSVGSLWRKFSWSPISMQSNKVELNLICSKN